MRARARLMRSQTAEISAECARSSGGVSRMNSQCSQFHIVRRRFTGDSNMKSSHGRDYDGDGWSRAASRLRCRSRRPERGPGEDARRCRRPEKSPRWRGTMVGTWRCKGQACTGPDMKTMVDMTGTMKVGKLEIRRLVDPRRLRRDDGQGEVPLRLVHDVRRQREEVAPGDDRDRRRARRPGLGRHERRQDRLGARPITA